MVVGGMWLVEMRKVKEEQANVSRGLYVYIVCPTTI